MTLGAAAELGADSTLVNHSDRRGHNPSPPLRNPYMTRWLTTFRDHESHDVYPDGCMDIVWIGNELRLVGPNVEAFTVSSEPGAEAVGLRFNPGFLAGFLGLQAFDLLDLAIPLNAVLPSSRVARWEDAVRAGTAAELLPQIVQFSGQTDFGQPVQEGAAVPPQSAGVPPPALISVTESDTNANRLGAIRRLAQRGVRVAEIADQVGFSDRQLLRLSRAAFGYGPKTLGRILRFRTARGLLDSGVAPAALAVNCGYADQAHFSREFRSFTGVTPHEYRHRVANRSTELPSGSRTTA